MRKDVYPKSAKVARNTTHHPIDLGQAIEVVDEIECNFYVILSLAHHVPPAQNVYAFKARLRSENFIACALLTKVKNTLFSNELISLVRADRARPFPIPSTAL
jgi:hypothetical protein